jgi:predicted transcriptional regulator
MTRTTIGIKVDEETRERLRALAETKKRTPHWLVKEALAQYLRREEARERERIEDEARWERFALTGESIPHERVGEWLDALAEGPDTGCPRPPVE